MRKPYISYIKRILVLIPALFLLPFGLSLYIHADIGADVLTSFQLGVSGLTGINVGNIVTIYNAAVLVAFLFINIKLINIGSVMMVLLTGPLITLYNKWLTRFFPIKFSFVTNFFLAILGTIFIAMAIAIFVIVNLGVSPVDMIVITIAKYIHKTYGIGMYIFYAVTLILALAVGGKIGVGTLVNFLLLGKLSDFFIRLLKPFVLRITDME